MKLASFIAVSVYLAFLLESILYSIFGSWGKPELMLLLVVFCNLYWGIRHSIWAAFVAGLLKDAFGSTPFCTYIFVYLVSAYLTTIVRNTLYQPGSRFSRMVVTFFVLVGVFALELFLRLRFVDVRFNEAVAYVFMPQMLSTMAAGTLIFQSLRDLVVRVKL